MSEEKNVMTEEEQRELRNSIFSAKKAAEEAQSGLSREQYAKQELGLEIPITAVPLPSAGKIYPPENPLHNKTQVEFRAMTAREEDILMSRSLVKKGTVITELIKSCLVNRDIEVPTMISGDRNALMVAIRVSGYGQNYEPVFTCPNCDTNNELSIDLAELEIKPLTLTPAEPFSNLFYFDLPVSKRKVGFVFLNGEEEEKILKMIDAKKKKGLVNDNLVTTRLMSSIVEIDGVKDRTQISKFVQYMPARDSLALRKFIDDNEPGVDMTIQFQCQFCDYSSEIQMPLGPSFFWPSSGK